MQWHEFHYPSVDSIANSVRNLRTSAQMYKIAISRSFSRIKVDPAEIALFYLKYKNNYFLDRILSWIIDFCMDPIWYIMCKNGFPDLFNYIDDLIYT